MGQGSRMVLAVRMCRHPRMGNTTRLFTSLCSFPASRCELLL